MKTNNIIRIKVFSILREKALLYYFNKNKQKNDMKRKDSYMILKIFVTKLFSDPSQIAFKYK